MSQRQLSPSVVLEAYRIGYFPMADHRGRVKWLSPDPRCIFEYDRLRISRSLRQRIRRAYFEVRFNTAFEVVIAACADRVEGTWISHEISSTYCALHRAGWAHSVECWREGRLVGGLYGVAIGGAFFGESMFHRETDASKVALVALMTRARECGFTLIDTQFSTEHLLRLGAVEIRRADYLARLQVALSLPRRFDVP